MRFVVIDGLDGCGKETQAKLLKGYLEAKGLRVLYLDYPCYGTDGCKLVEMYLRGELGKSKSGINAYEASCFYAMDRLVDSKIGVLSHKNEGYDIIIANRYTTSNAIYMCTKLPKEEWDNYCEWLFDFEYNKLELPVPTDVVYLTMPVNVSRKLLLERYNGDTSKLDLNERDNDMMLKVREVGVYMVNKLGWIGIDCTSNGVLSSREKIHQQIVNDLML